MLWRSSLIYEIINWLAILFLPFSLVFKRVRSLLGGNTRVLLSGGAPLSAATQRFMNVCLCCPVGQGYGLTETCGAGTITEGNVMNRVVLFGVFFFTAMIIKHSLGCACLHLLSLWWVFQFGTTAQDGSVLRWFALSSHWRTGRRVSWRLANKSAEIRQKKWIYYSLLLQVVTTAQTSLTHEGKFWLGGPMWQWVTIKVTARTIRTSSWMGKARGGSAPETLENSTLMGASRSSVGDTPPDAFVCWWSDKRVEESLFFPDRKKDLVKLQAGEYVSLGKVEAILKNCPYVDNICAYANRYYPFHVPPFLFYTERTCPL